MAEKWQKEVFTSFRVWKQADNRKRYAAKQAAQSIATALTAAAAPTSHSHPAAVDVWPFGLSTAMILHPD